MKIMISIILNYKLGNLRQNLIWSPFVVTVFFYDMFYDFLSLLIKCHLTKIGNNPRN